MQRLCSEKEITGEGKEFRIDGGPRPYFVMLFRCGDAIVGYQNVCPHRHLSLSWAPDRFLIGDDGLLVCPHHGAAFDLASGDCVQGPCSGDRLIPVDLELRDGEVWLA